MRILLTFLFSLGFFVIFVAVLLVAIVVLAFILALFVGGSFKLRLLFCDLVWQDSIECSQLLIIGHELQERFLQLLGLDKVLLLECN